MKITPIEFPDTCYVNETFQKSIIFLHHTASSSDPYGVIGYWKANHNKVGTPYLIAGKPHSSTKWVDGEILRLFPSDKGVWHLGLTAKHLAVGGPTHKTSKWLNMCSVGIEICSWGGLTRKNGKWISYASEVVLDADVYEFDTPYRGYHGYHKYTEAQIAALHDLMVELGAKHNISLKYKGDEMFDVNKKALCGEPGVWAHVSVRPSSDKQDVFPYPPLIEMLKTL